MNGPELLDKFVGGSEDNVRKLFVAAEKEQAEMGDASMLHIIIFDEMDAIMKKRGSGSDSTGAHDGVVNQLLSKIDGVDSLNVNILPNMNIFSVSVFSAYKSSFSERFDRTTNLVDQYFRLVYQQESTNQEPTRRNDIIF